MSNKAPTQSTGVIREPNRPGPFGNIYKTEDTKRAVVLPAPVQRKLTGEPDGITALSYSDTLSAYVLTKIAGVTASSDVQIHLDILTLFGFCFKEVFLADSEGICNNAVREHQDGLIQL